ncbi:MAG: molybdenum cofactor biosynthesis protein MoaE [Candidatus Bathyarchaeota archaeon]
MTKRVGVHRKGSLSLADIIRNVKKHGVFHKAGAIVTFIGVVRGQTINGDQVKKLELEAYEEKADEVLLNICEELKNREGVIDVQIHHMLGEFEVGEEMVYVVVAGSHRRYIFPVLRETVDRYKREAPIFKKEYMVTKEGKEKSYWVTEHDKNRSFESTR